jgi:hypothetical protein
VGEERCESECGRLVGARVQVGAMRIENGDRCDVARLVGARVHVGAVAHVCQAVTQGVGVMAEDDVRWAW